MRVYNHISSCRISSRYNHQNITKFHTSLILVGIKVFRDAPLRESWRNNRDTIVLITRKESVIGVASLKKRTLEFNCTGGYWGFNWGRTCAGDKKLILSQNTLAWTLTAEAEVWHINYQMSHMQTSYQMCFGTSETQQGFCSFG